MKGELFVRYKENPVLTPERWPYPVQFVFNPAAALYNDEVILLVRVSDRRDFSHLTLARSNNGRDNWKVDKKPTLEASEDFEEFKKGLEDPRIVLIKELEEYIIACVSFRINYEDKNYGISLIGTKDFRSFRRISKPLNPENKNASLFPRKINGSFALIHRPILSDKSYIAVSFSEDLIVWGDEKPILCARPWYWDSNKVGIGCPPIETEKGWLLIYHGSCAKANKLIYRVGLALLDLETLDLTHRSEEWVFGPKDAWDGGDDGIVFPCGCIVHKESKQLDIYYGTNDSKVGLATADLNELIDYVTKSPVYR